MSFFSVKRALCFGLVALSFVMGSYFINLTPAHARGCNGVVNQFEWGCAYWDNNNGPQFPHYVAPRPAPPAVIQRGAQPSIRSNNQQMIRPYNGARIVPCGGGN